MGFFGMGAGALLLVLSRHFSKDGLFVTPGTNLVRVSVEVTHGTNHLYYYRGKVRWMWNDMCKRFGWRLLTDCEQRHSWTYEPADMLWVTCEYPAEPLNPADFRAVEVMTDGRKRMYSTTGGYCDKKRRVTLSNWGLQGGIEKHRGSVIHVKYGARELARIKVE
jgi:hypothetical protein